MMIIILKETVIKQETNQEVDGFCIIISGYDYVATLSET
jgi:hypothetical protein